MRGRGRRSCRRGDRSVGQVAKDFDPTETAVRDWVRQAQADAGERDSSTSSEHEEGAALRPENRCLRKDVEILKRAVLDSIGQGKALGWGSEPQALARTVVELRRDGVEVVLAEGRQVRPLGQVLAEQLVGVLVAVSLPGAPWCREDRYRCRR